MQPSLSCRPSRGWRTVAPAIALVAVAGCSQSELDLAEANGVVVLDGKPLENAGVVFQPGYGPVATGVTDSEGRFTLVTGKYDGALVGEHIVTVNKFEGGGAKPNKDGLLGAPAIGAAPRAPSLPKSYGDPHKTSLRATIEAGKVNTVELSLDSQSG